MFFLKKLKQSALDSRFALNISKRKQRELEHNQQIAHALNHPEDIKAYRKALRTVALRQTGRNISAFSRWSLYNLSWLFVIYAIREAYLMQMTNSITTMVEDPNLKNVSPLVRLFSYQSQLQLTNSMVIVITLLAGYKIISHGWFHRPYKKGSLAKEMKTSLDNEQSPIEKHRQQQQVKYSKNKRRHKK